MNTLENTKYSTTFKRYYPWVVIALSASFLFYKYVLQVSPSVMGDELMRHFHINGAGLGNLAATFFYSYLVTQLFVGVLLDRFNPRWLSGAAIALCGMGAVVFATADNLLWAELGRGLIGIGAAFATVSYMKMAAIWFNPNRFAFVGGLLATAAMIGSMAGEAPLAWSVVHFGWQDSLYYIGWMGVLLSVLFCMIVRGKRASRTTKTDDVSMSGFKGFATVLKKCQNWYLMLYSGLAFSPLAVFGGLWGNPFLQEAHHITKTQAASLTSLMFFGLALGGPLLGYLSDRLGKRFIILWFSLLVGLLSLGAVIYVTLLPDWLVGVLLFVFGFSTGAFMLGFAVGRSLNAVALTATVVALINSGDALFGAFTEPFVGRLLDLFWGGKRFQGVQEFGLHDYHIALSVLPIYLLLAAVFLLPLRRSIH